MTELGKLRIAVVGAGIAGLGAAWLLSRRHDVDLYEAEPRPGGHANTVEIDDRGRRLPVDTGFIVYNETNYPNLTALFDRLAVPTKPSDMSFSVSLAGGRLEYAGGRGARGLLAQPANILRPRFQRMLRDVLRFYRDAPQALAAGRLAGLSLRDMLETDGYGAAFREDHLLPMAAAIWSGGCDEMLDFPAESLVRFFDNHGLLRLRDRPQWRSVSGGSREYVRRMLDAMPETTLRLNSPVAALRRHPGRVELVTWQGAQRDYDQVILATHGDQALRLLSDPTPIETAVLGGFRYRSNRAVLHRDPALMPRGKAAWASWNAMTRPRPDGGRDISVSYWMNRLQSLDTDRPVIVSLDPFVEPAPNCRLGEFAYRHPQFDLGALEAQGRLPGIQGMRNTWFCGSYTGYGFHEDALMSGFAVADALGAAAPWDIDLPVHLRPRAGLRESA
jgi:predicted NAD/FAD-binding protein